MQSLLKVYLLASVGPSFDRRFFGPCVFCFLHGHCEREAGQSIIIRGIFRRIVGGKLSVAHVSNGQIRLLPGEAFGESNVFEGLSVAGLRLWKIRSRSLPCE